MEKKNVYIGQRYVPKIDGVWDIKNDYEGLTVVLWEGNSYTSKKHVPAGIDILNEEYWVSTGNYNAQVENYRKEVKDLKTETESSFVQLHDQLEKDKIENDKKFSNVDTKFNEVNQQLTEKGKEIERTNESLNEVKSRVPEPYGIVSLEPHPLVTNPILTADDVTDVKARFLADPFYASENGVHYSFFEVTEEATNIGHIGYAKSVDEVNWKYQKLVIKDGVHTSFPYVFKVDNQWYMLPERGGAGAEGLTLFKATRFPDMWEEDIKLFITGSHKDAVPFQHNGVWYIISYNEKGESHLYYASTLRTQEWTRHPQSPIITGHQIRPAGRPIQTNNYIDLFIQDGSDGQYGEKLFIYRITDLSTTSINIEKIRKPVLEASHTPAWNGGGMHHADVVMTNSGSLPFALVDGHRGWKWAIGLYTMGTKRKKPIVKVVLNGNQTFPKGELKKVEFNQVSIDNMQKYNSDTYTYTIPEDGYYDVTLSFLTRYVNLGVPNTFATITLFVNGSAYRNFAQKLTDQVNDILQQYDFTDTIYLRAGDIVHVGFQQNSQISLDLINTMLGNYMILKKID